MISTNELPVLDLPQSDFLTKAVDDPKSQKRMKTLVDNFRADAVYTQKALKGQVRKSAENLIPEADQAHLPGRTRAVLQRYAVADTLAIRYRDRTYRVFLSLLACSLAAMVVLEVFAHALPEHYHLGEAWRQIIWLFPGFWFLAFLLWMWAHLRGYQKKFHDYRALAEGLRVQVFWSLLGIGDPVEKVYLRKQRGELEWIRRTLSWWRSVDEKQFPRHLHSARAQTEVKSLICRCWIDGQRVYFARVAEREKRRSQLCKSAGLVFLSLSLLAAAGLGWYEWSTSRESFHGLLPEQSILIFALAIFLSLAALAVAYGEKMAFAEHARQYSGTSMLYDLVKGEIHDGPLTERDLTRFRQLGNEALQENGDWLLIHRDRPLEVIVP